MSAGEPGAIILLNGPSSAGKSTLCQAIQDCAEQPFLQFSLDFFMFGGPVLPRRRDPQGPFSWAELRPRLFEGYFRCLPALAGAGNHLVLDYIIENEGQRDRLVQLLGPLDVFLVGVHCPLPELERRERQRGDRRPGDARRDLETVHSFLQTDLDVDSTRPPDENARRILSAWAQRQPTGALARRFQATSG
ncbi:chloramphenicol phosphotransferase CPT family protein [Deinococcus sonorensis]|uniref:AAA family ATPase n=2 Tax=Deinococcus sonorensis TaxID=309891 RepID=A0AAU7UER1_9DEIO